MSPSVKAAARPRLRDCIERVIILAYQEDTGQLQCAMREEGFADVAVQRAVYTKDELAYSRNFRCFMNQRDSWKDAAARPGWTLIIEADFVPCTGFGAMSMPVPAPASPGLKWAFLYAASPRIMWEEDGGFLRGHQATTVCNLVTGAVAARLLLFWEDETKRHGVGSYFSFDSHMQWTLIGMGCEAYFPLCSYGEHGGLPNREHREKGSLPADGTHRADVLAGDLAFLPAYAKGYRWKYWLVRFIARIKAIARLATGRWRSQAVVSNPQPVSLTRLTWIGLRRQLRL